MCRLFFPLFFFSICPFLYKLDLMSQYISFAVSQDTGIAACDNFNSFLLNAQQVCIPYLLTPECRKSIVIKYPQNIQSIMQLPFMRLFVVAFSYLLHKIETKIWGI